MTFNESPQPDILTLEAIKIQLDGWRAARVVRRHISFPVGDKNVCRF